GQVYRGRAQGKGPQRLHRRVSGRDDGGVPERADRAAAGAGGHGAGVGAGVLRGGQGRAVHQHDGERHGHHPGRAGARQHRVPPPGRPGDGQGAACVRPPAARVQAPVRLRPPAGELGGAGGGQRPLRPRRDHPAGRRLQEHLVRPAQARAGQGGPGGDLPPAPRRDVDETPLGRRRRGEGLHPARGGLDVPHGGGVVRPAGRHEAPFGPARLQAQGNDQRRAAADVDEVHRAALRVHRHQGARALGRGARALRAGLRLPLRVRRGREALAHGRGRDLVEPGVRALEGPRPREQAVRGVDPGGTRVPEPAGGGV
ncbi:MAG: 1,2-phenylacetyl-CoA epoxidase, subunit A, partial [uncultured Gemmatimonadetes bacterium]